MRKPCDSKQVLLCNRGGKGKDAQPGFHIFLSDLPVLLYIYSVSIRHTGTDMIPATIAVAATLTRFVFVHFRVMLRGFKFIASTGGTALPSIGTQQLTE